MSNAQLPTRNQYAAGPCAQSPLRQTLLLAVLASGCLSGEQSSTSGLPHPECTPSGEVRQYAVYEYQPTRDGRVVSADINGKGQPSNSLGNLVVPYWTEYVGGLRLPREYTLGHQVNELGLQRGRGVLLLDVLAEQQGWGCSRMTLRNAEPSASGQWPDHFDVMLGSPRLTLASWGNQQQLSSASYALMDKDAKQVLDMYFPLLESTVQLRIYRVHIELSQSDGSADQIEGVISGVIRKEEFIPKLAVPLAAEATTLINKNPDMAYEKLRFDLKRIESPAKAVSRNKCSHEPADCCLPVVPPGQDEKAVYLEAFKTCRILPEELESLLENSTSLPDLYLYKDNDGIWQTQSDARPDQLNSYSMALAFKARRTTSDQPCRSGTFCSVQLPDAVKNWRELTLGWASSSSDLWLVGGDGELMHHDGLAWSPYTDAAADLFKGYSPSAIWGSAANDIWMGGRNPDTFRHWDGSRWRREKSGNLAVNAVHGTSGSDIWAAVSKLTDDGNQLAENSLLHYDGSEGWTQRYSGTDIRAYRSIFSPQPNTVVALDDKTVHIFTDSSKKPLMLPTPSTDSARSVWGSSATALWIMTGGPLGGSCAYYDGTLWPSQQSGCEVRDKEYQQIWGDEKGRLWAVGTHNMVRTYDSATTNATWQDVSTDLKTDTSLIGVFGVPAEGAVWALGINHTLLRYQP